MPAESRLTCWTHIIAVAVAAIVWAAALDDPVAAAPPEICRVQGGNTKTVWGVGFKEGETVIAAWSPPFDEAEVLAALAEPTYRGRDLLPAEPPAGTRRIAPLAVEPRGLVLAVAYHEHYNAGGFYDARAGEAVLWANNAAGWSRPWLVRGAQPWWVYPERAAAGGQVRVFGRQIDARLVALKDRRDGRVTLLGNVRAGRNSLYECRATLPADLPPGEYDLFVHNGAGGAAGWGGPVRITIEPAAAPPERFVNVRDFGARGDGFHDDTSALRQALVETGEAGGGVVHLPPGRYAISATLWVPEGVTLQGAGRDNSVIAVNEARPMRFDLPAEIQRAMPGHWVHPPREADEGIMVWLRDRATLADVGLESGPGVWLGVLAGHTQAAIRRCRLRITHGRLQAIQVTWGSYGFTLEDSDLVGRGGLFMLHGPHRQAYVGRNHFRALPAGESNNLFIRAPQGCVIEDNVLENADRNWCSQLGLMRTTHGNPDNSGYHTILQGNLLRNNIPRRHNAGENMYEAGGAFWHGPVAAADRRSISVAGEPFAAEMRDTFVLVLDGRGLGQYRRVVESTASTLTVDPPWDVTPDATTYVAVNGAYAETLWIDNTEEHTANWSGFWGFNLGHVVDGHVLRDGEGLYFWAWQRDNPSPVAFCDVIGSRMVDGARIVLRGPLVFGNTIRFSEVVRFGYRPSLHIQPTWVQGMDPARRAAVALEPAGHSIAGLPEGAPLKAWNVIEAAHICGGPLGIAIAPQARYTILRRNALHLVDEPLDDPSAATIAP